MFTASHLKSTWPSNCDSKLYCPPPRAQPATHIATWPASAVGVSTNCLTTDCTDVTDKRRRLFCPSVASVSSVVKFFCAQCIVAANICVILGLPHDKCAHDSPRPLPGGREHQDKWAKLFLPHLRREAVLQRSKIVVGFGEERYVAQLRLLDVRGERAVFARFNGL